MKRITNWLYPWLLLCVLLLVWQISAIAVGQPFLFPAPTQVLAKMVELNEALLFTHLPATLAIIVTGLSISFVLGVVLAIAMYKLPLVERAFYPVLIASQTIPIIALAPLFVLWFGYGLTSKVVVTVLITFFPITVSTFDGFRTTKKDYLELMKTMGASKWQLFCKVEVPSALPSFLSGMKVAVTLSVIGAAIGEWLGAQAGLGYFSRRMMTQFDGAGVFAPIVWLSLIGIALFLLIRLLEASLLKWRQTK
ncbi:ABC transporter permease [Alkalihalobacillus oceani]|uniref:ABC transporter permease n=1 Tax=Halalkalibacter oceani TaxID=1653776 RepID=A0A9X2ILH8_9BACI|nr:ABC transporter permease [Halalkalibacter oceani]MCM3712879.1 ABC transporter permease [Halalkalibacter oceani]